MSIFPPFTFDGNEWFQVVTVVVLYPVIILMPKRFPLSITLLVMVFCLFGSRILDSFLSLPPLDFYDYNDTPKQDLMDVFVNFIYPPFGYLFLYFYDKWRLRNVYLFFYIVGCAFFSTGFEWIGLKVNLFRYKNGWQLIYSFSAYLAILSVFLLFYLLLKNRFEKTKLSPDSPPNLS